MTAFNTNISFGYNYGNISSSTNIVNGVAYTQNIINLENNGTCSNSPNYCQEGYSLYVPCLKSITRGQNICLQLYIADKSNQDTLDLNDMCGLTLDLSGQFNCPYNSYTYPEDISSLQSEEITELKCQSFDGNIFRFDVGYLEYDESNNTVIEYDDEQINAENDKFKVNVSGIIGDFYEGETPYIRASDSSTHIFVGWTTSERISELCDNFKIDDLVVADEQEWIWEEPITKDITLYAIYRKRKKYKIMVSFDNRHSYFMVYYNNNQYMLSDKERDFVEVTEGYHFLVKCCPLTRRDVEGNIKTTFIFYKWGDGNINQSRQYLATDEIFQKGLLRLFAICNDTPILKKDDYNFSIDIKPITDFFETNKPDENNIGYIELPFIPNETIYDFDDIKQVYDPKNKNHGFISLLKNGYISFDSNSDGGNLRLILTIDARNLFDEINKDAFYTPPMEGPGEMDIPYNPPIIEPVGEITVKNGNNSITMNILSKSDTEYIFEFDDCENGIFEISSTCENLHIDNICVFEKTILNKGLVELCISPEDTSKFYTGILNMSGAICVNDNWYSLDSVSIGNVTKNKPIKIISQE